MIDRVLGALPLTQRRDEIVLLLPVWSDPATPNLTVRIIITHCVFALNVCH